MSDLEKWWDLIFQKTIAVTYYSSAAYFLISATIEGYFWGFASGLITAWLLPFLIIFPWLAIITFGSIQILGMSVFGYDPPFDWHGLWLALRAVWLLVSALNIWVATVWNDDSQTISEVWEYHTADWIIFNN